MSSAGLYLDLLKRVLTGAEWGDPAIPGSPGQTGGGYHAQTRRDGADWPLTALTMIGLRRLDSLQHCIESVLADGVPGDLIETGVWRGGACIFMRAVLAAHGVADRAVWAADSFCGFPPDAALEADRRMAAEPQQAALAVGLDVVKAGFARFGLLDDQVRFAPGWFADTLPPLPVSRLAVLRLDGDLHTSTTDALTHLYPKLSPGGFCIIDDYQIPMCRDAVTQYREACGVTEPVEDIDGCGVLWRRRA